MGIFYSHGTGLCWAGQLGLVNACCASSLLLFRSLPLSRCERTARPDAPLTKDDHDFTTQRERYGTLSANTQWAATLEVGGVALRARPREELGTGVFPDARL